MSSSQPSAAPNSASRNRLLLTVYTAAIFVSALLLFSVQPLFTKMVLPRLGGSPAVWSVAMVFFQSLLLGGYAYAHFLMQLRSRVVPGCYGAVLVPYRKVRVDAGATPYSGDYLITRVVHRITPSLYTQELEAKTDSTSSISGAAVAEALGGGLSVSVSASVGIF